MSKTGKGGLFRRMFRKIARKDEAGEAPAAEQQIEAPAELAEILTPAPATGKPPASKPEKPARRKPAPPAKPAKQKPETKAPAKAKPKPKPEPAAPAAKPRAAEPQRSPAKTRPAPAPEKDAAEPAQSAPARDHETAVAKPEEDQRRGWFARLKTGLSKSSKALSTGITDIFTKRRLDDDTLQELEDILIQADLGVETALRITESVADGRYDKEVEPDEIREILASEIYQVLAPVEKSFEFGDGQQPFVVLVVGVNGTGKTTTIGKLAAIAGEEGFSVMLAACDTFRAAAVEQLQVWGKRAGADVMVREQGADASGLAFDALASARENGVDILIVDTAGRLQNKADLMAELEKIIRVLKKQDSTAPHAVLLILDATTGQNAISQAEVFQKVAGVTGIIMTKLDGTARGGILVAIAARFGLPVHAIGVGEQIEDLRPFDAREFSRAIAGLELDNQ